MFYVKTPTGTTQGYATRTEAIQIARSISESRPGVLIEVVGHIQYTQEENAAAWSQGLWKEETIQEFLTEGHYNHCGND